MTTVGEARQRIVLLGLACALVASGAGPILGNDAADAAKKDRKGNASRHSAELDAALIQSPSNPVAIGIGDNTTVNSTIEVSGFSDPIVDVDLTLKGYTHGQTADIDMLLIGPRGQTAVFLSDVGSTATAVTVTLDDQAANQVSSTAAMTTGSFQPTNFQSGDSWILPAGTPPIATGSELGVFNGTNANGVWTLYIHDELGGPAAGTIVDGWSLRITSANGVPTANPDSFQAQAGKPLSVAARGVLDNDRDPDNDTLTAIATSQPRQGTLDLQADGGFTYTPNKKAKGTDSFTYLAQDPDGLKSLSTVDLQITKAKKKKKGKR